MIFIPVFSGASWVSKSQNDSVLLALVSESQEAIHTDKTFPEKHFTPSEVVAD
jgi:hypothetical protein